MKPDGTGMSDQRIKIRDWWRAEREQTGKWSPVGLGLSETSHTVHVSPLRIKGCRLQKHGDSKDGGGKETSFFSMFSRRHKTTKAMEPCSKQWLCRTWKWIQQLEYMVQRKLLAGSSHDTQWISAAPRPGIREHALVSRNPWASWSHI